MNEIRTKGAGRLTVARFDRHDSSALRRRTPPGSRPPRGDVARTLRYLTSPAPAPHSWSSAPWVPTPRTEASRTSTSAGRATETVPTSECRRRDEGTGERITVIAPSAGSAGRGLRRVHLRRQGRNHAPGLGGRIHDPDTLPSSRKPRARGPRTSRVPEPAPLRMRSRRGLRVRFEPVHIPMVRGCFESSRTVFARGPRGSVRHAQGRGSFELDRACPKVAWVGFHGRRGRDASDRLLHSETVSHSSTRALVDSQRGGWALRCLSTSPDRRPRPEASRLRARLPWRLFHRLPCSPEDVQERHREARGPRCETRLGGIALHGAFPTSALVLTKRVTAFSSVARDSDDRLWLPCRLLRARGSPAPLLGEPAP